jgi:cyclase
MLKKRIIPCLDIRDGRTVKGINFVDIRDAGDPVELARSYQIQGADELVFLDITATVENRGTLIRLVEQIAAEISIPFTVGGGLREIADVEALLAAGADKVSINSSAVARPTFLTELAENFGSQCVVLAIDTNEIDGKWQVFTHGGRKPAGLDTFAWAREAQERGAGEILLTSMAHDGTKKGFAVQLTAAVSNLISIPVIASGGAGTAQHFAEIFTDGQADAALAASIFHFGEVPIPDLKAFLKTKNISPTRTSPRATLGASRSTRPRDSARSSLAPGWTARARSPSSSIRRTSPRRSSTAPTSTAAFYRSCAPTR